MTDDELMQLASEEGFSASAVVSPSEIVFDSSFRKYCEENYCGQYGVNYSCPPVCGTPEEMKKRIQAHQKALVLQTIWEIPDLTDKAAVKKAKALHNASQFRLLKRAKAAGMDGFLAGASGCALCSPCKMAQGLPCSYPDLRTSCMSAYCIYVKKLAELCGMDYVCGTGKVAFFGMFITD